MPEQITHDEAVGRYLALQGRISFRTAMAFFLNGLSGEQVRGRQVIISYLYMRQVFAHQHQGHDICAVCGIPKVAQLDAEDCLQTWRAGHAWNEQPVRWIVDLEDVLRLTAPAIEDHHIELLRDLLAVAANVQADETPGRLEKRVAASRLLRKTDRYKRYGILQALAELGILRNDYIRARYDGFVSFTEFLEAHRALHQSARSDVVLPLAGWNARSTVNADRLCEIIREALAAPGTA